MIFEWHDHHFITGVACLDLANTVVWRSDAAKMTDRLRKKDNLAPWIRAAKLYCALPATAPQTLSQKEALTIRDACDPFFRTGKGWSRIVCLYAKALSRNENSLASLILGSAVALRYAPEFSCIKICGNCGWLFIDRTRNQNKKWCISAMCGSRTKAKRYYERKRKALRRGSGGNGRRRAG
jgi:predicted RNA-binding Zn ribbon-like protein